MVKFAIYPFFQPASEKTGDCDATDAIEMGDIAIVFQPASEKTGDCDLVIAPAHHIALSFSLPQKKQVIATSRAVQRRAEMRTFSLPQKKQVIATASYSCQSIASTIFQPASEKTGDCDVIYY